MIKLAILLVAALTSAIGGVDAAERPAAQVILPAARDVNAPGGLVGLRRLIDVPMRDAQICVGRDGAYYLTGTTNPAGGQDTMWTENDGIRIWKSLDLVRWTPLGLVWSFDRDATWAKAYHTAADGKTRLRALWAPELHYLKGTYWICYCTNNYQIGILKSTSGMVEGPYADTKPEGPIVGGIDASLFQDDDGTDYLLHDAYSIARLKPDLSGLAEPDRKVTFQDGVYGWGEGICMVKVNGHYVFVDTNDPFNASGGKLPDTYDCASAVSMGNIYGPYTPRRRAIPHDGHNNVFRDRQGKWWATYFGSGPSAPWAIRPGVLPVEITPAGNLQLTRTSPRPLWRFRTAAPPGAWTQAAYDDTAWKTGAAGFGDPEVTQVGPMTDVGTEWKQPQIWMRKNFAYDGKALGVPNLYLRHSGPVDVFLNGRAAAHLVGSSQDYTQAALSDPTALRKGNNTLCLHCLSTPGLLNYLDAGLVTTPGVLVPTSEAGPQDWRYTTAVPAPEWTQSEFDDRTWSTGPGLFGSGVPGVRSAWTTSDIWLRRTFIIVKPPLRPALRVFHDEDVDIYVDGRKVTALSGFSVSYETVPLSETAQSVLTPGAHTLAVHCRQTTGGQGVDVGIIEQPIPPSGSD